MQDTLDIRDPG